MNRWKAALLGFFDGCGACVLMFNGNIRVPGSSSSKLIEVTEPEMLREYSAINPLLPDLLLKWRLPVCSSFALSSFRSNETKELEHRKVSLIQAVDLDTTFIVIYFKSVEVF